MKSKIHSYTNLTINKPDATLNKWHGDFGYSTDGKFFTYTTLFGESASDVQSKVEHYLKIKFKPEEIVVK